MANSNDKKASSDPHELTKAYYAGQLSADLLALKNKQHEANTKKGKFGIVQIGILLSLFAFLLYGTAVICISSGLVAVAIGLLTNN